MYTVYAIIVRVVRVKLAVLHICIVHNKIGMGYQWQTWTENHPFVSQVQLDRDRLKEEFHSFKHEKEKRVSDLEGELISQQQRYDSEIEALNSEKAVVESSNTGKF